MLRWLNHNLQQLLSTYKNQYIAYNAQGIIAHGKSLQEVLEQANVKKNYLIDLVPRKTASIQILPIHFRF